MTADLFADAAPEPRTEPIVDGAVVLRAFALADDASLLTAINAVITQAPLRRMQTPGGLPMSVAITNCGSLGWVSDERGYRYAAHDPVSGQHWPAMPAVFLQLAQRAATATGFVDFVPDACLINRYEVGARMSLHQDKNEGDFSQPIVSVSLGLPAVFQFGGLVRGDRTLRVPLAHGDVVVWGGDARLRFHGVLPLKTGSHAVLGAQRINLTFRKAG
ncbi:MAG: DNA oxidative demethylase AlkB [Moraxellaceae bacterium]|nr:DNA oxidative demethylase AlkB [Moraxellaceae bacterium]